ncbi:S8 family serine peptidase [Micromonospora sp. LH3U1]|uniref:S8 family serine peptidase n=1 Tax=Micromonospora sp. LH3U1 TaxID=3018339 RepID=UPI002349D242|nr:S8 family serine peptidase [Micromonospora sp. LH3U1]WCN83238.1 S8 family serine peptidase [Micromonospora sp. LH3U1]
MSLITRSALRAGLAVSAVVALLSLTATAAHADEDYVKYYTVTSSQNGAKENLSEIAERFVGDSARSPELFNLNSGRPQPDGGVLVDPARLNAGWILILPWDAVGGGVQYGVLPDKSPTATVIPKPGVTPTPSASRKAPPAGGTATGTTTPTPAKSPSKGGQTSKNGKGGPCATAAASSSTSSWAQLRLAADQAWPQSRGKGQLVAVVDSGADGSLPQLTGHVAVGSDIVTGSGRGDTDCLGTGTAMAGLIAAQPGSGGGITGVAPDSTVLPIRIADTSTKVRAADAAAGINAAIGAGATVIALGPYVDAADKGVADAIADALKHDVVVVLGAARRSTPAEADAATGDGRLRVGGVGVDGQGADDYRKGGVDVVAPGVNVTSTGITGTGSMTGSGTHYAVAFVAGTAALVRSAYPELTAQQVAHRLQATADKIGSGTALDGRFGAGMINPAESVTKVLPEEAVSPESDEQSLARITSGATGGRSALLIVVTLVALAAAVLLVVRIRRLLRDEAVPEEEAVEPPAGDDTPPPATRPPAVRPSAQRDTAHITPGARPGTRDGDPAMPTSPTPTSFNPEAKAGVPVSPGSSERGTGTPQASTADREASVGAKSDKSAE